MSQAFEHDRQLMQEQDKNNNLALEQRVLHDRLTNAYRQTFSAIIASNEEEEEDNISAKDR